MTNVGHLYPGFHHAGALLSVNAQRAMQAAIVEKIAPRKMLVVGSGYGEELDTLLASPIGAHWSEIVVIDLANVRNELANRPNITRLGQRLSFRQLDLLKATELEDFGTFDFVQCSFVLHDIEPREKDLAFRMLAHATCSGGHILISDIFTNSINPAEAQEIYDCFIKEASIAVANGLLHNDEFEALVGDGSCVGLKRSRAEAVLGERDFFEPLEVSIERARRAGLILVDVVTNPQNKRLFILLFRQECEFGNGAEMPKGEPHVV
jgi:hypothetical protein